MSSGPREKRLAEQIRADLEEMLARGTIRDPEVQGVIISDVEVTQDLGIARVFVRVLDEQRPDEARRSRLVAAMRRAGGFLRRELASRLQVRRVPELRFMWDEAADRALRLESIFDEIRRDGIRRGEGER